MPTARRCRVLEGRKHPRKLRRFLVHMCSVGDPLLLELTAVENISSRGARVATQYFWEPGSCVEVKSTSGEYFRPVVPGARARVVYCQSADAKGYAVGLDFLSQTNKPNAWNMAGGAPLKR